jgi:hypothetical protein
MFLMRFDPWTSRSVKPMFYQEIACEVFCRSLFVPVLLAIVFRSLHLRFTASDYPFNIFKHFSTKVVMMVMNLLRFL